MLNHWRTCSEEAMNPFQAFQGRVRSPHLTARSELNIVFPHRKQHEPTNRSTSSNGAFSCSRARSWATAGHGPRSSSTPSHYTCWSCSPHTSARHLQARACKSSPVHTANLANPRMGRDYVIIYAYSTIQDYVMDRMVALHGLAVRCVYRAQ